MLATEQIALAGEVERHYDPDLVKLPRDRSPRISGGLVRPHDCETIARDPRRATPRTRTFVPTIRRRETSMRVVAIAASLGWLLAAQAGCANNPMALQQKNTTLQQQQV